MLRLIVFTGCAMLASVLQTKALDGQWPSKILDWRWPSVRLGAELQAGVAVTDITPPVSYGWGQASRDLRIAKVQDPLMAKALVLKQKDTEVALLICDLRSTNPDWMAEVRDLASRKTGIPSEHILVTVTHTHTAPAALTISDPAPGQGVNYPAVLLNRLAETIIAARRNLQPAALDVGQTSVSRMLFQVGGQRQQPTMEAAATPDAVGASQVPANDPASLEVLGLILTHRQRRSAIAGLTIAPIPARTMGGLTYSADYPAYLERALQRVMGKHYLSLLANNTCEEDVPMRAATLNVEQSATEMERLGGGLAQALVNAFPTFESLRPMLGAEIRQVTLPMEDPASAPAHASTTDLSAVGGTSGSLLDRIAPANDARSEVQVIRLAREAAIVSVPSIVYQECAENIRKESPFRYTIVLEQCFPATVKTTLAGGSKPGTRRVRTGGSGFVTHAALESLRSLELSRLEGDNLPRVENLPWQR